MIRIILPAGHVLIIRQQINNTMGLFHLKYSQIFLVYMKDFKDETPDYLKKTKLFKDYIQIQAHSWPWK